MYNGIVINRYDIYTLIYMCIKSNSVQYLYILKVYIDFKWFGFKEAYLNCFITIFIYVDYKTNYIIFFFCSFIQNV